MDIQSQICWVRSSSSIKNKTFKNDLMKNKLEGDELLWMVPVPGWFLYTWALDNADVRNVKICGSDNSNSKHVEIKSNDQFSDFRCRPQ